MNRFLFPLGPGKPPAAIGHKAASLHWLAGQQAPIPRSWVIPWPAFERWRTDGRLPDELQADLEKIIADGTPYAVRSSANVEDGGEHAFAGQFASVLDVRGSEGVAAAIETVYRSTTAEGLRPYLDRAGLTRADLKMGVIVQEMIPPAAAGVVFTRNPLTGLDEIVLEAVEGSGEQLMQEGVTPERWVYKWGKWLEQPDTSPHTGDLMRAIVARARKLAAAYGQPADLEWVYDGRQVTWVQIRPIGSLHKLNIYSNRISREVLPGIIKPLVWSVNVPMINSAWIDIFTEMIGANDIEPVDLSRAFHYRAYFNMATIGRVFTALGMPEETLELMMGLEGGEQRPTFRPSGAVFRHLPRLLRFVWQKMRFGREIEAFLPIMRRTYAGFAKIDAGPMDEAALLVEVDRLFAFNKRAAYFNIVGPLLAQLYTGRLNIALRKVGLDPNRFDVRAGAAGFDVYDPTPHLAELHERLQEMSISACEVVAAGDWASFRLLPGIDTFRGAVDAFLDRFGHMSDSGNDFSQMPWREKPGFVLEMIARFTSPAAGEEKQTRQDLPAAGPAGWRLRRLHDRARRFQLYREQVSGTYTYGYGLFRPYFLALGRAFTDRGLLESADDIFYLSLAEIRERVAAGAAAAPARRLVARRRAEIEAVADAVLPDLIYGDDPPPLETAAAGGGGQATLSGVPTSRGYFQGAVCVIRRVSEFSKMRDGAVLVIPYSDVSWTPLFAKAGAVIAESGGMLSHSSIVAREYGLPAVVSVTNACRLLGDGELVSVDGFQGTIIRHLNGQGGP